MLSDWLRTVANQNARWACPGSNACYGDISNSIILLVWFPPFGTAVIYDGYVDISIVCTRAFPHRYQKIIISRWHFMVTLSGVSSGVRYTRLMLISWHLTYLFIRVMITYQHIMYSRFCFCICSTYMGHICKHHVTSCNKHVYFHI